MASKNALKNVVENMNGSELPARLLGSLDPSHKVRVTVEDIEPGTEPQSRIRRFAGAMKSRNTSIAEAVERIRVLRDEPSEANG